MITEFSGKKFGWQAARRGVIFLVVMFGVPFALYAADKIADPDTDVTLTEAIRVTTATPVGFYAYLLLVLSLIPPIWKRMKSLRLPGYLGFIVPLLMLADLPYFLAARSEDTFGMSVSAPDGHLPLYLMTAIALVVAMTLGAFTAGQRRSCPSVRFRRRSRNDIGCLDLARICFYCWHGKLAASHSSSGPG
jgi:hypothetical protein